MNLTLILNCWLILTFITAATHDVNGEPEVRHIVCLAGGSVQFHCDVNSSSTKRWDFRPTGSLSTRETAIFNGDKIKIELSDRFSLPITGDARHLTLIGAILKDSGRYKCDDDDGAHDAIHINLTVIAAVPSCSSNETFDGLDVSDVIQIRCQVDYRGQQHPGPRGQCRLNDGTTETATLLTTANNDTQWHVELLYNVVIQHNMHNTNVLCTTYFTTHNMLHPLSNNNNKSVLYSSTWTSPTVNIMMFPVTPQHPAVNRSSSSLKLGLSVAGVCASVAIMLAIIVCVIVHFRRKGPVRSSPCPAPDVVTGSYIQPNRQRPSFENHPTYAEVPQLPSRNYFHHREHDSISTNESDVGPSYAELRPSGSMNQLTRQPQFADRTMQQSVPMMGNNIRAACVYASITHNGTT